MPANPEFVRVWNLWQADEEAIQRVRDLHRPVKQFRTDPIPLCSECIDPWPCSTIKVLDDFAAARGGEQA